MIDPRQARFGQAITGSAALAAFLADEPLVLVALAAVLGPASILGGPANLYAYVYRGTKRLLRLGPPAELEEAAPPRFANFLGFLFTGTAAILALGADAMIAAWTLTLLVSALALLSSSTGLCVGCEAYVLLRRVATRGRVTKKLVVPRERVEAGA